MIPRDKGWKAPSSWTILLMGTFLVIASGFDAWMTLEFIALGGEEANPYVLPVLAHSQEVFIVWKLLIGLCTAVFLGFASRAKRWAWWGFNLVIWAYLGITGLHFWIIIHLR